MFFYKALFSLPFYEELLYVLPLLMLQKQYVVIIIYHLLSFPYPLELCSFLSPLCCYWLSIFYSIMCLWITVYLFYLEFVKLPWWVRSSFNKLGKLSAIISLIIFFSFLSSISDISSTYMKMHYMVSHIFLKICSFLFFPFPFFFWLHHFYQYLLQFNTYYF